MVRDYLPRTWLVLNGVVTRGGRCFDPVTHWPNHKEDHIELIKKHVSEGDHVVEVGTGYGVCTVWCAREGASVTSYEAGEEWVDISTEAVEVNEEILDVELDVEIQHGIVGTPRDTWGDSGDAERVDPSEVTDCDLLLLDCEGSEVDIVPEVLGPVPKMIVESHKSKGVNTSKIISVFEKNGYQTEVYNNREVDVIYAHV